MKQKANLIYTPRPGTSIAVACQTAISRAKLTHENAQFTFNGIKLIATPNSIPKKLEAEFMAKLKARADAYQKSPEGIAAKKKRAAEIIQKQHSIDKALTSLKSVIGDPDKLMHWIKSFADNSDDIDVKFSKSMLADELEAAGYINNEHVGQKPKWFSTRERMSRYIIGQAISCLRSGLPPHPITASLVKDYFDITS